MQPQQMPKWHGWIGGSILAINVPLFLLMGTGWLWFSLHVAYPSFAMVIFGTIFSGVWMKVIITLERWLCIHQNPVAEKIWDIWAYNLISPMLAWFLVTSQVSARPSIHIPASSHEMTMAIFAGSCSAVAMITIFMTDRWKKECRALKSLQGTQKKAAASNT